MQNLDSILSAEQLRVMTEYYAMESNTMLNCVRNIHTKIRVNFAKYFVYLIQIIMGLLHNILETVSNPVFSSLTKVVMSVFMEILIYLILGMSSIMIAIISGVYDFRQQKNSTATERKASDEGTRLPIERQHAGGDGRIERYAPESRSASNIPTMRINRIPL